MLTRINDWLARRMKWNDFGQRWSVWRTMEIMDRTHPDQVYLKRLRIIQTPLFGLYVHWIYLPDNDRDCHDHPWNFWSFVARGAYAEYVRTDPLEWPKQSHNVHQRFSLHRMTVEKAHKITYVEPGTITVLLIGRRTRDWGFWTDKGWVHWREYNTEAGKPTAYGPDPFDS